MCKHYTVFCFLGGLVMPYAQHKEGDLYKILEVGGYIFELRFGFYADFERECAEPVVIYPDLNLNKIYTKDGKRIVTAIQDPCVNYKIHSGLEGRECCSDCVYYRYYGDDIGICMCELNHKTSEA